MATSGSLSPWRVKASPTLAAPSATERPDTITLAAVGCLPSFRPDQPGSEGYSERAVMPQAREECLVRRDHLYRRSGGASARVEVPVVTCEPSEERFFCEWRLD